MGHIPDWLATFSETGDNLGIGPAYLEEKHRLAAQAPRWWSRLRLVWTVHHRLRRLLAGHYSPQPLSYHIYWDEMSGAKSSR